MQGTREDQPFRIPPDLRIISRSDVIRSDGEINWGMTRLGVAALRDTYDGDGVTVGIVDTGCGNHPLVADRLKAKKSFVPGENADDGHGHGSHCTGTVGAGDPRIGVGNKLGLLHGKGLSNEGSGAGTWIAAAMMWCAEQGAEVISMSLGSSGRDTTIESACRILADAGVWVICAAGNSGPGTPDVDFPGRFETVISVAAIDSNLSPASFSSAGAKIDTSGPGVDIWSIGRNSGYVKMSGTSMATPFVAGLLGCYRSGLKKLGRPIPKVDELRRLLNSRSTDTHTPGDDNRTGPGWADAALLANTLKPDPKLK